MKKPKERKRRYVRIFHDMMETAAWKSLTANEQTLYLHIARRYNGSNNGRISFSVRQAKEALQVGQGTAERSLHILVRKGFIVVTMKGAFHLKNRHASEYRLTEYPYDGSPATMEFKAWRKENDSAANILRYPQRYRTVPVAVPNGTCGGTERKSSVD